jgi:hypothetical protein
MQIYIYSGLFDTTDLCALWKEVYAPVGQILPPEGCIKLHKEVKQ